MLKNRKLYFILCAPMILFATFSSILFESKYSAESECKSIRYEPRSPENAVSGVNIDSVSAYSITQLGNGWSVFDHIGYKDSAFQGARHTALMEGGLQFFGYDKEPLSDMALINHPTGEDQIINTIQSPIRADWHTLDGNGILFGCEFSGFEPDKEYNVVKGEGKNVTITGYSVVATASEIEVRQYSGATIDTIAKSFTVLYEEPKKCPGQNFTVEIKGDQAKIFLGTKEIYKMNLGTSARGTGLITSYAEHCCPSLSSVCMFNHTVNGVDYLKSKKE